MKRIKVSVFLASSLDGYIAGERDDLSWLEAYSTDSPDDTGYSALMNGVDVMVLGRNSYDVVSSFDIWPYAGKRIVVMTHRPLVPRHGEETYAGPFEILRQNLAREGCRHIYLDGGIAARQGLAAGVVDELTISWVPVVLGKGIPLFAEGLPQCAWRLRESKALPSGLLQGKYVPAREAG